MPDCGANGAQICLNYNGDISFCVQLMESFVVDKNKEFIIGHITDDNKINVDLEQLDVYRHQRMFLEEPECMWCPSRFICATCTALNLKHFNNINRQYRQCGVTLAEVRAMIYLAEKAKETDYPYFKAHMQEIRQKLRYDPTINYLVKRQDRERQEAEQQNNEEEPE